MTLLWYCLFGAVGFIAFFIAWRWASRMWSLPCPTQFAWLLESPFLQQFGGTETALHRLRLQPGQHILEIGPGPGRLLVPSAKRVLPGGEAVGIDIQPGMIDKLQARAQKEGVTNLTAILGDATESFVDEDAFDLVFLVTALGEIPDRSAALAQSYRALKPGGVLSITEMFGDPHYQSRRVVKRLAEKVEFQLESMEGHWWLFTANFVKPSNEQDKASTAS